MQHSVGTPALWIGFSVGVLALLALDLIIFHKREHEVRMREALAWSGVWIGLALAFNFAVYHWFGTEKAIEFLTGYLIEKALSVDNLFVFVVVFSYFAVPPALQHRVLFWGIIGALVARAVFIVLGAELLERVHAVMYVFGGFLVFTGIKLLFQSEEVHPERNPVLRLFKRVVPMVHEYHGPRFTIVQAGKRYATPLLMVVAVVEASDIMFAVDSIPAVFAVTRDPFIVYTSNIFAILGLRALYFVLARVIGSLRFLKIGLSCVLMFVGAKMLLADVYHMPVWVSLCVIVVLIGGSALASIMLPQRRDQDAGEQH